MQRKCDACPRMYEAVRPNSRFCSDTCRKRAQRGHLAPADPPPVPVSSVAGAAASELRAVGRLDSSLGQAALALAARIDNSNAVNGYAALVKEYRETMAEALKDVSANDSDALDEIQEAALRLLHGA